jgi:hypothetical protein
VFDAQQAALRRLGHTAEDETAIFGGNFDRLFPVKAAEGGTAMDTKT